MNQGWRKYKAITPYIGKEGGTQTQEDGPKHLAQYDSMTITNLIGPKHKAQLLSYMGWKYKP